MTKGKTVKDGSLEKYGYRARPKKTTDKLPDNEIQSVTNKAARRSWARLIQKVYEVDPLICEKCGHEKKIVAVITNSHEVRKILECLKRNNAPPFDKVEIKAS